MSPVLLSRLRTRWLVALAAVSACGDSLVLPADPATLRIAGGGSGSGIVTAGTQPVIQCQIILGSAEPGACEATYAKGTAVTLQATPASGPCWPGEWDGGRRKRFPGATGSIRF